jgi:hypothetical protein
MDSQFNLPNNEKKLTKVEGGYREISRLNQEELFKGKRDEDLIIEENTIYEIDRNCVERLKRNRRR